MTSPAVSEVRSSFSHPDRFAAEGYPFDEWARLRREEPVAWIDDGAHVEIRALFDALLERLPALELAGPVERLRSKFVGGIKHLPARFAGAATV